MINYPLSKKLNTLNISDPTSIRISYSPEVPAKCLKYFSGIRGTTEINCKVQLNFFLTVGFNFPKKSR